MSDEPKARTYRYRCHRLDPASCMTGTPWERHAYDIVPAGWPNVPGECNDDADGEDPGPGPFFTAPKDLP